MKKIAFLFLTIENPNFPQIWDKYFRGHKDKYNIYIHPKYPEKITWHNKNIIENLKPTGWGFIVEAYIELMRKAIKDPDNYKFITISESCIPIQSFDKFYDAVTNDSRSWIKSMKISHYNYKERLKSESKNFIKNYARFCLNRDHINLLLSKEKELKFFYKMHVGDEFFLSVLNPLKNTKDFAVIYDDWDYVKKKGANIKNKIKKLYEKEENSGINTSKDRSNLQKEYNDIMKNPKTIINVEEDLEKIKKCSSFFYRKFSKDSNIEKYWKDIINAHN